LLVYFLQHIQKKLLEIDCSVAVFVHGFEHFVDFFLIDVIAESAEEELQGATGDVAGVVSIVHFEDFFELFDLLGFVGGEGSGVFFRNEGGNALEFSAGFHGSGWKY
jgi:hypothetical protein